MLMKNKDFDCSGKSHDASTLVGFRPGKDDERSRTRDVKSSKTVFYHYVPPARTGDTGTDRYLGKVRRWKCLAHPETWYDTCIRVSSTVLKSSEAPRIDRRDHTRESEARRIVQNGYIFIESCKWRTFEHFPNCFQVCEWCAKDLIPSFCRELSNGLRTQDSNGKHIKTEISRNKLGTHLS